MSIVPAVAPPMTPYVNPYYNAYFNVLKKAGGYIYRTPGMRKRRKFAKYSLRGTKGAKRRYNQRYRNAKRRRDNTVGAYRGYKRNKTSLRKQVKSLAKEVHENMGQHTRKVITGSQIQGVADQAVYEEVTSFNPNLLDEVTGILRYWDTSTNSFVTKDQASIVNVSNKIWFKNIHSKLVMKNNNVLALDVRVYELTVKDSSGTTPNTAFTNGAGLQQATAASPWVYPSEIDYFNKMYRIVKTHKKILAGGAQWTLTSNAKDIVFDPGEHAQLNFADSRNQTKMWFIRVVGTLSHSGTIYSGNVGFQAGILDYYQETIFNIHYEAGATINEKTQDDQIGLTTAGRQTPYKANQTNQQTGL